MKYLLIWLSLFCLYTIIYILFPVEQAVVISGIVLFVLIGGTILYHTLKPSEKSQFETTPEQQALIEYQKALEKSKRNT